MSCAISAITFEHYPHGLGVSHSSPRLSWSFDGSARDWKQAQYEIRITRLTPTTYSVSSPDSILVPWPAPPLQSRESAVVEVRVRSSSGEWTAWATERLEAALLERNDWSAKLVTASDQATRAPKTDPISYFSFVLPGGPEESVKPVRLRTTFKAPSTYKQARLYVTACGVHYTFLNGQPVSPDLLEPGWTKYDTTLAYRTYDVTALINGDTNILASWVGEGWYAGRLGYFEGQRHVYGHRVGLIAQLEVDGQVVARSGNGWQWSYGAIAAGEIYDGEAFDSRIDDEEWKTTVTVHGEFQLGDELTPLDWKQAQVLDLPTTTLVTSESPPIRPYARLQAKELITTPSGKTILDLAQNFAGFVQVVGQPPIEGTLTFRFAEVLEHGELGTRPLMGARATDSIILGGRVQGWTPKFTFHGFRYVEVSGWPGVTLEDICGVAISSAMNQTGTFTCSHMLLNRLHENVVWSTRSNTISIPSDCPQRAERLGWTGDIQIFAPTINYLFNSAGFLRSWLRDLRDEQEALGGGRVPCVIPHLPHWNILSKPHAVWGDVSALLPDDLHLSFGDSDILKESFASMTDWLDRGIPRNAEGTWDETTFQYADWLAPASPPDQPWNAPTDSFLVANAYLIHTTRKVARIAQVLGRPEEAERYEKQATDLLEKFHANYVTPKSRVLSDTQAALALILHFDLVKPGVANQRDILTRRLGELVGKDRWQVSTGFAGEYHCL